MDALFFALGAVLTHIHADKIEKPIAYVSCVLSDIEQWYPQIEKEGLTIILGIQIFNDYLYAHKFTLVTDHKPLYIIFGQKKRYTDIRSQLAPEVGIYLGYMDFLSRIKVAQVINTLYDQKIKNFIYVECLFVIKWTKIKRSHAYMWP